jgi:hypothetical protein
VAEDGVCGFGRGCKGWCKRDDDRRASRGLQVSQLKQVQACTGERTDVGGRVEGVTCFVEVKCRSQKEGRGGRRRGMDR